MLTAKCPHCGGPLPLELKRPEAASCGFCGREVALSEPVAQRLAGAAQVLSRHQASERQLGGVVRLAVTRGALLQGLYLGLAAVVLGPASIALLVGLANLARSRGTDRGLAFVEVLALGVMVAVVGGIVALSVLALRRARARVERAAAAVPPLRAGEPARCYVCGAPLEGAAVRGVARCSYCGGDNLTDPAVLSRASRSRLENLEDYAAEVERNSAAVPRAFGRGSAWLLTLGLASPFVCALPTAMVGAFLWALGMTGWALVATNRPPEPGNRYGLADVEGAGRCVVWFNPESGRWERDGARVKGPGREVGAALVEPVSLDDLVGRRLRIAHRGDEHDGFAGRVSRPRWFPYTRLDGEVVAGSDRVRLGEPRERVGATLWRLCLAEDEDPPPAS